jgi:hypothetical protein
MIIKGIQNQLKLRKSYYKEVSYAGGFGCLVGGIIFYNLMFMIIGLLGIDPEMPIRQFDQTNVLFFALATLLGLAVCLYMFASTFTFAYFSLYLIKGSLNVGQVVKISFMCRYPDHWYRKYA